MPFTVQPIGVDTCSADESGLLVLMDGRLVAVLVRLDDPAHGEDLRGRFFLECGLGKLSGSTKPAFGSIESALDWIEARFAQNELTKDRTLDET